MKEHIINILKEVAANPPSAEEMGKKADLIISLFEKQEEKAIEPIYEDKKAKK